MNGNAWQAVEEEKPEEPEEPEETDPIQECISNGGTYWNGVCSYDQTTPPDQGGNTGGDGSDNSGQLGGDTNTPAPDQTTPPSGFIYPFFKRFFE